MLTESVDVGETVELHGEFEGFVVTVFSIKRGRVKIGLRNAKVGGKLRIVRAKDKAYRPPSVASDFVAENLLDRSERKGA